MLDMLLKYKNKRLTVYLNFKIMIFLKFNFEFFAIVFLEKMHGKRALGKSILLDDWTIGLLG